MKMKYILLIIAICLLSCNNRIVSPYITGPEISLRLNADSTFEYLYNYMDWEEGLRNYSFGTYSLKENNTVELNSVKFEFNKIQMTVIENSFDNYDSLRINLHTCFNKIEEKDFNTIIYLDSKPISFIGTNIDTTLAKFNFKRLSVKIFCKGCEKNLPKAYTSSLKSVYYIIDNQASNFFDLTFAVCQDDFYFKELKQTKLVCKKKYFVLESGLKVPKSTWPFSKCKRM